MEAWGAVAQGWARVLQGEGEAALANMRQGQQIAQATGTELGGVWSHPPPSCSLSTSPFDIRLK